MKKEYIIIIIVLLLAGGVIFAMSGKNLEAPTTPVENEQNVVGEQVACTMEAKLCPDGSSVGRTGPNCEFAACPSSPTSSQPVKEFVVTGENFSFSPSVINVNKGDRVKIVFKNTQGFHDFVVDEFGAATKQAGAPFEETIEFTADKSGSFEYYCSVGSHRAMGMKGTLVVK